MFEGHANSAKFIVMDILSRANEIHRMFEATDITKRMKVAKNFGWQPPTWPFYKLNTDGACKASDITSADRLIREAQGVWVGPFSMNIGMCASTLTELLDLYQGYTMAWNNDIRLLHVEVDRLYVIQLLQQRHSIANASRPLINGILNLLSRSW